MNEQSEEDESERGEGPSQIRQAGGVPVVTARLILRPPLPGDAAAFAGVANNMDIASQMSGLPHPFTEKDAESWIAATQANTDSRKISFVIALRGDGTVAGATGIRPDDDGDAEINYFLGDAFWGRGLATEAAQGIIDHAFTTQDIERIVGRCRTSNRGSRRVLEKCGFQYAGSGMCNCTALNSSFASDDFILERSVWTSLRNWGRAV